MLNNSGWNALYLENHDMGRAISRYASDAPAYRSLSSKMIATHLVLQSGTVFVYQGQELAMPDVPETWAVSQFKDIEMLNHWDQLQQNHPDDKELHIAALKQYRLVGRDSARTPMQWSDKKYAGFSPETSSATLWMDIHPDYQEWNVARQISDPASPYSYWRDVLALRKVEKDVFVYGGFEMVDMPHESVVAYLRTSEDGKRRALVVTNFAGTNVEWDVPGPQKELAEKGKIVLANYEQGPTIKTGGVVSLRPYEAFVTMI